MRKILIPIFLFCIAFIANSYRSAGQTTYPLSGHPRLFFLSEDEPVLQGKLNAKPELKQLHNLIVAECDKMLSLPVQQRVLTGVRLLSVSREAIRRIGYLSYAYRMTGDTSYAARAETEMLAMTTFSDWNPSHFLDVGEMTLALAIGYDWLYSFLTAQSRSTIAAGDDAPSCDVSGLQPEILECSTSLSEQNTKSGHRPGTSQIGASPL